MLIIGEQINSSRKVIKEAISKKDAHFLIEQADLQTKAGASFIDVNCAISMEKEEEDLVWLIQTLQDATPVSISIDSPNSSAIDTALKIHRGKPFINSITAESVKMQSMLDVLKGKDVFIIALTMDDSGIPQGSTERIKIAKQLVNSIKKAGINPDNIFVDPLAKPISSEPDEAKKFLESIKALKQDGIKTIGGLSNVSYGLPVRRVINAIFLSMAIEAGIDAAIIDPVEELTQKVIKGETLSGKRFDLGKDALLAKDFYCSNYIKAFREGKLNG